MPYPEDFCEISGNSVRRKIVKFDDFGIRDPTLLSRVLQDPQVHHSRSHDRLLRHRHNTCQSVDSVLSSPFVYSLFPLSLFLIISPLFWGGRPIPVSCAELSFFHTDNYSITRVLSWADTPVNQKPLKGPNHTRKGWADEEVTFRHTSHFCKMSVQMKRWETKVTKQNAQIRTAWHLPHWLVWHWSSFAALITCDILFNY
jgi:hypothetical protein